MAQVISENARAGFVHSVEAGSCLDGPGMRVVLFMAGCLLRCQFCHNPDTWGRGALEARSEEDVVGELAKYADFLRGAAAGGAGGGVTVSGGEPMAQWPFVETVLQRARAELGLHTAVQTAAFLGDRVSDAGLGVADLWMVDLKSADAARYREVTGVEQGNALKFLRRLAEAGRETWVSYVLVPGLTDEAGHIEAMGVLLSGMRNVTRVEIRPFHQMGREKWAELGLEYKLRETATPGEELIGRVEGQLRSFGLPVVVA